MFKIICRCKHKQKEKKEYKKSIIELDCLKVNSDCKKTKVILTKNSHGAPKVKANTNQSDRDTASPHATVSILLPIPHSSWTVKDCKNIAWFLFLIFTCPTSVNL